MILTGKKVAILGGGGGIGRAVAFALAVEGASLFIGDVDEACARSAAEHLEGFGLPASHARCDIGDDTSVKAFADRAFDALGRVDVVINHAGVSLGGLLEEVTSEDWAWLLNANVIGVGRSVSAFLPRMTVQGGGWIVNTSSGLGLFHDVPFAAPYIASKAAIIAYSRALATYARNRRIGVSVFCPDITMTNFLTSGRLKGIPPELAGAALPTDRIQTPEQAAALLVEGLKAGKFLISAVPGTSRKLAAMAVAELAPGSDANDPEGGMSPVRRRGSLKLPKERVEEGMRLFEQFAQASRRHYGCGSYAARADGSLILVDEVWESQAALDAHAAAPDTLQFVQRVFALGASDFQVAKL